MCASDCDRENAVFRLACGCAACRHVCRPRIAGNRQATTRSCQLVLAVYGEDRAAATCAVGYSVSLQVAAIVVKASSVCGLAKEWHGCLSGEASGSGAVSGKDNIN